MNLNVSKSSCRFRMNPLFEKKSYLAFLIILCLSLPVLSCKNSTDDDLITVKDAKSFYQKLTGKDITKGVAPLVVVDENGKQTTISNESLVSHRAANRILEARAAGTRALNNDLGWHPLAKDTTTFCPTAEMLNIDSEFNIYSYEDASGNYSEIGMQKIITNFEEPGVYNLPWMIKANIDNDGEEEIICFNFVIGLDEASTNDNLIIYSKFGYMIFNDGRWGKFIDSTNEFKLLNFNKDSLFVYMLGAAFGSLFPELTKAYDLDGDGIDEIIITEDNNPDLDEKTHTAKISVLKYNSYSGKFVRTAASYTLPGKIEAHWAVSSLACTDHDHNGKPDIAFLSGGKLTMLEYDNGKLSLKLLNNSLFKDDSANVIICGNFKGKGTEELIIISNSYKAYMLGEGFSTTYIGEANSNYVAGDFNGDGNTDFIANFNLYTYKNGKLKSSNVEADGIDKYAIFYYTYAADIDGDGKDEFIIYDDDDSANTLKAYSYDGTKWKLKHSYGKIDKYATSDIVFANIDKDSAIVQYVGHELKFTNPIPLYALAAAPYFSEIVNDSKYNDYYDPSGWSTAISKSQSNTDEDSNTLGFSILGKVEMKIGLFAAATTEIDISANFNHTWSSSMTVGQAITFDNGGAGDNTIIFSAAPIDVFSYEVIQEAKNPPEGGYKVGDIVTIKIPRTPNTYTVPVDYYNKNNGDEPDVLVFSDRQIGQPSTYPSKEQAMAKVKKYCNNNIGILTFDSTQGDQNWSSYDIDEGADGIVNAKNGEICYFSDQPMTLSMYDHTTEVVNNPTTQVEVSIDEENGRSISAGVEVSVMEGIKADMGAASVSVSAGLGLNYDHEWTSSVSKGISFTGTVGNVPIEWANANSNKIFSQGMYVYPAQQLLYTNDTQSKALQQPFWVIDYFVEY